MNNYPLSISDQLLYQEAKKRGITCTLFNNEQYDHMILMEKGDKRWFTLCSRNSLQSSIGRSIAQLKFLTKSVLTHYKLPTAPYVLVYKDEDLKQVEKLQPPLVMKPIDGNQGKDVIVGIKDYQQAQKRWKDYKDPVIFEEMFQGIEYRVVCVDYKFVAATFRKPCFITGDGKHTIQELIDIKNKHPWRGEGHESPLTFIKVDDLVTEYLEEQGCSLTSVPKENEEVFLRKTANLSTGGEPHDMTDVICEENKQLFEQVSRVCDLNVIGIDVMCQSLETPIINQQKAGIIEVNASPGLRMHHYPLKGKPRNVAGKILDMIEEKR